MTEVRTNGKLTQQQLKELLFYCPETGKFTRKTSRGLAKKGNEAGHMKQDGYRVIGIGGGFFSAHRLAWVYMTGEWPICQIDHVNRDRADNRFENLRLATPAENAGNKRALSASGYKGVYWYKGRWDAKIYQGGRGKHLGRFDTPEEASDAYLMAAKTYCGEFASRS